MKIKNTNKRINKYLYVNAYLYYVYQYIPLYSWLNPENSTGRASIKYVLVQITMRAWFIIAHLWLSMHYRIKEVIYSKIISFVPFILPEWIQKKKSNTIINYMKYEGFRGFLLTLLKKNAYHILVLCLISNTLGVPFD